MRRENGFSLIELLIVVAIILIIAAIAIPSLMRARISANHSAATGTMRTMNTAQYTYAVSYPQVGYSGTFPQLGPAAPGAPCSVTSACLLDEIVACAAPQGPCVKSGYNYFINDGSGGTGVGSAPPAGSTPNADYTVSGTPVIVGKTGDANFCSTAAAVVAASSSVVPPLPAPPPPLTVPGEVIAKCLDSTLYGAIH